MGGGGDGTPPDALRQRDGSSTHSRSPSSGEGTTSAPQGRESSGVLFYPPSDQYWRIGGQWYDFNEFIMRHPGGETVMRLARDRYEDCTFAFEAHHHDYRRARALIKKFQVPEEQAVAAGLRRRPARPAVAAMRDMAAAKPACHFDKELDAEVTPSLLDDDAFYSVMRQRVTAHLNTVGCPAGGPTTQCKRLFWITFFGWAGMWAFTYATGSFVAAIGLGFMTSWLGAFGHNWVHQPKYKLWAYLSLDTVGFSSDGWFREHVLQHHMYTNTPWDNHFHGTDPFLTTDPTIERNVVQRYIMPYINPLLLCFGLYANYIAHFVETLKGNEVLHPGKLCLPVQIAAMVYRWGPLHGGGLIFACNAVLGMYYFTMALMNHNAEQCLDVKARNASKDWGEAQLHSSADWGVQLPFLSAGRYLWLNYHTVHHLFPRTDFSHHPAIQKILMETTKEFKIKYVTGNPVAIYLEMVRPPRLNR